MYNIAGFELGSASLLAEHLKGDYRKGVQKGRQSAHFFAYARRRHYRPRALTVRAIEYPLAEASLRFIHTYTYSQQCERPTPTHLRLLRDFSSLFYHLPDED